jgi:hypothetical protein
MSCALTAEAAVSTWSSLSQESITKTAEARLYIVTSRAAETGGMIAIRISLRQATENFFSYTGKTASWSVETMRLTVENPLCYKRP